MKSVIFGAGGQDGQILAKQIEANGGTAIKITPTHPANPLSAAAVGNLMLKEVRQETKQQSSANLRLSM